MDSAGDADGILLILLSLRHRRYGGRFTTGSLNVRSVVPASFRKTLAVVSLVNVRDKQFPLSAALSRASSSFHSNWVNARARVVSVYEY